MRIGMVVSSPWPPAEGMGFYVWNLAKFLTSEGHHVQLITRGGYHKTDYLVVEDIKIWRYSYFPIYPFHTNASRFFISRILKAIECELDLLHIHSPLVLPPPTRLPILVTIHTPLKADIRSVQARRLLGFLIRLQTPFSIRVEQTLFTRADRLVAVASSVAREAEEYDTGTKNVTVLGNGVDTDLFTPRLDANKSGQPYFLTVSRLAPRKGLEDLIEAARLINQKYSKAKFLIVGSGPLHGELTQVIKSYRLESNVVLMGQVKDRLKLVEYYRDALAYVHPAHYEGLPTVLLEAMACGKAVVVTAVSGALDVVNDKVNGLLVPPRRPDILAQTLMHVLDNPEAASELGVNARLEVCRRFSWKVIGERYLEEYRHLLGDK